MPIRPNIPSFGLMETVVRRSDGRSKGGNSQSLGLISSKKKNKTVVVHRVILIIYFIRRHVVQSVEEGIENCIIQATM